MTLNGQNLRTDRYALVPRTLTFLRSADTILLLKLPESKGDWSGRYNGVGGHIEQGESPHNAARREVKEETGLDAINLRLCGAITVDTQTKPGIGLFVFVGEAQGELQASPEGELQWIALESLGSIQLIEDLPTVLPVALDVHQNQKPPFSALYSYSPEGQLEIEINQ